MKEELKKVRDKSRTRKKSLILFKKEEDSDKYNSNIHDDIN